MKVTTKNQAYILLVSIITLVCYTLFYNAKTQVETVEVALGLSEQKDSLRTAVIILRKEKDSVEGKITSLDSTLTVRDAVIKTQNYKLVSLRKNADSLKVIAPIIIRDTVYITETKSFWGKTKRKIETVSDTIIEFREMETDSIQIDTIPSNN